MGMGDLNWRANASQYAFAIVDDAMCGGDAIELIHDLAMLNPLLKILLVCERVQQNYIKSCIDCGAWDFFQKLPDEKKVSESQVSMSSDLSSCEGEEGEYVIETSKRFPLFNLRMCALLSAANKASARKREQDFMRMGKLLIASLEAMSSGIQIFDADGTVQYANLHFSELMHKTRFECIGESFVGGFASKLEADDFVRVAWPSLKNGSDWKGDISFQCKDGSELVLSASISPFEFGDAFHYIAITRDASRVLEREKALLMETQRASEVARFKSSMLFNTSHDIRNLMTGVIGVMDVLRMKDNSGHEEFKVMEIHAKQIVDLTNDLLELSRVEAHALKIELEDVQLGMIVPIAFFILGRALDL
eukprot:TRINITY_DN5523_c0_g1_i4.p1 TRINITY_DN5523_c0_g1~~TRINITY_DN5523_c0_g1_i4.p1  ORF type:complete len:399 (-),score=89.10 TRINITY_DN5523_c0_g1_i4:72-1160(-)